MTPLYVNAGRQKLLIRNDVCGRSWKINSIKFKITQNTQKHIYKTSHINVTYNDHTHTHTCRVHSSNHSTSSRKRVFTNQIDVMLFRSTDAQVATIKVCFPRNFFGAILLYLRKQSAKQLSVRTLPGFLSPPALSNIKRSEETITHFLTMHSYQLTNQ